MRRLSLTLLLLFAPLLVAAEPSTNVAWTPELLEFVANGDSKKGQELSAVCSGCHGEKGISQMEDFPSLAGQLATYTYKQLRDYADGKRTHALMNSIAAGLSEQDSADLAAWFASLTPALGKKGGQTLELAEKLVRHGNSKKIIPPCFACHGRHGEGNKQDIPALAGQQPNYFIQTLNEYKTGVRKNDVYRRMRLISQYLTEEEIQQLAQYYYQLQR